MTRLVRKFIQDQDGGPAAEFAMVLPMLLFFLLGIVDVGRLMWDWNRAEKATQMGVRYAVATDMVPSDLESYSFSISGTSVQGEPVSQADFPGVSCSSSSGTPTCTCLGSCSFGLTANSTAFTNIVARISAFKPDITADDVIIDYAYSGLGFAGDPTGPDVAPLVTVRLRNLDFQPLITQLFGLSVSLPEFRAALTLEDGDGDVSN